ncbi:MAG: family 16 glycosylhydrolase [Planctomycetota bacterium]
MSYALRNLLPVAAVLAALANPADHLAAQEVLFEDAFDGAGNVDTTQWRLPFDTEGTFVGRTQFRGDPAVDFPQQVGGSAILTLDTLSGFDPGNALEGHDLITRRNFARGGGLIIEARMRLDPTSLPAGVGGVVNGFFLFDVTRDSPPGGNNLVRDEIDWELLSNEVVSGGQRPATNFWNEGPFVGPGSGGDLQFHSQGVDLTQFNDYRVEWTPSSIQWFVNGSLVRSQFTDIPDDPMELHFNLWAADAGFTSAFDNNLQPSSTTNQEIRAEVDHVRVTRFNTLTSDNLLVNGDFEGADPVAIGTRSATATGEWLSFGNTFIEDGSNNGVLDPTGVFMLKAFGPFGDPGAASGVLQRVEANPGEEFEGRVSVLTAGNDSILGTDNFTLAVLRFLRDDGSLIQEAFADPGELVDSNGQSVGPLDGRDPNAQADVFVEGVVSALAPAETALVEFGLFFIQLAGQGGSAFFNDASLVRLTPETLSGLAGDFNDDGIVDGADYALWRNNLNGDASVLNGNGDGSDFVDAGDLAIWRAQFNPAPPGAIAAAPEPAAGLLALAALCGLATRRRVG